MYNYSTSFQHIPESEIVTTTKIVTAALLYTGRYEREYTTVTFILSHYGLIFKCNNNVP